MVSKPVYSPAAPLFGCNDFVSAHCSGSGIGSVRRGWDQTNISMRFASRCVIRSNGKQTSILSSGSTVWLQRDGIKSSHFRQPRFHLGDELLVPFGLVARCKRMDIVHRRPRHRIMTDDEFNFIVQDPRGIIAVLRPKSL